MKKKVQISGAATLNLSAGNNSDWIGPKDGSSNPLGRRFESGSSTIRCCYAEVTVLTCIFSFPPVSSVSCLVLTVDA